MKTKENDVISKLDKIAEKYASLEALRPVLQLIPFGVGSAIDSLFGNRAYAVQHRRILEFLNILRKDLERLDETKIDYNFLKSDNFFFLCRDIFSRVANTRELEKIHFFKNIFLLGIATAKPSSSFIDLCIQILESLAIHDIFLMKALYNKRRINGIRLSNKEKGDMIFDHKISEALGFESEGLLHSSIIKLSQLGLVQEGEYSTKEEKKSSGAYMGLGLSLSSLGKEFVKKILSHKFESEFAKRKRDSR